MDSKLTSKELFCAATDVLTLGLTHDRVDDAEAILGCLRAMRPRIVELDSFEAWILMKRGNFKDASRLLANVESSPHGGLQARALLAYCFFATGDGRWNNTANQIIDNGNDPDAAHLMKLLMDPEGAMKAYVAKEEDKDEDGPAKRAHAKEAIEGNFLRA